MPDQTRIRPLGGLATPTEDGRRLRFQGDGFQVLVQAIGPGVVRVRTVLDDAEGGWRDEEQSFAVASRDLGAVQMTHAETETGTHIEFGEIDLEVQHDPFRVVLKDRFVDRECGGIVQRGQVLEHAFELHVGERVFGLGETSGTHDKRGPRFQGSSHVLWNNDAYAWNAGHDPLYAGVPWLIFLREGECHGIFVDDPGRVFLDIGHSDPNEAVIRTFHGVLDRYLFVGPTPAEVLARYLRMTGLPLLPPRWALGLHQCRYSYENEQQAEYTAQGFRVRKVACDAIWLDIHHLRGFRPFTWDLEAFPDPERMITWLRERGFRTVVITDPHLALDENDAFYAEARDYGFLVTRPGQDDSPPEIYRAPVWPGRAEKDPVDSVFPDFTRKRVRDWWGKLHTDHLEMGVAGIWNDMNEPAVFEGLEGTFPHDLQHQPDGAGQAVPHQQVHNAYGRLMTEATYEGLSELRPEERPFVLTRSSWAGGQRFAAIWIGDTPSTWDALQQSIRTLLGLMVSGFSTAGADIGGFTGSTEPELLWRWIQGHMLMPFFRLHTDLSTADQEPWSFGEPWTERNRRAIRLRYRFLPEIEHAYDDRTKPPVRPLWFEFPDQGELWSVDDAYLLGHAVLVAPILRSFQDSRHVKLPNGRWIRYPDGQVFEGDGFVPPGREGPGLFLREGYAIELSDDITRTDEMESSRRTLVVVPRLDGQCDRDLLERHPTEADPKQCFRWLRASRHDEVFTVELTAREGDLELPDRPLTLRIHGRFALEQESEGFELESDGEWTLVQTEDRGEAIAVRLVSEARS